ncbi:MAG: hypothetical protein R2863_06250 [Candidatus Kapaibacterium sp.]
MLKKLKQLSRLSEFTRIRLLLFSLEVSDDLAGTNDIAIINSQGKIVAT